MKTLLTLQNALYLAGGLHFAILSASALVPVVLDWKTVLKPLPAFVRTLFWVYGLFIVLMIVSLGTVTLLHAPAMVQGDPVARTLAGMIAVFWGLRLIVQLFIFDASAYLTNIWLKLGDHALTVVFLFFTTIFTLVALRPGFLF
ncbi:MAG TPA: hypothetical protein VK956_00110 [Verrucomicrobium sp.]|nr:hypothetical protein [Verrucomicrobium sp.]